MNLTKIFRISVVVIAAALGYASPGHAAVSAFFNAGANCAASVNNASFSTGGPPVQVSLCMTTTSPSATCGHTIILESAAMESGRFVVVSPVTLGSGYSDPNSEVSQLPLAINNPAMVADFGGTGSAPVPFAANQLLATFNLAPQASATNASYVISLNSASSAAVDADGTCGATTVPSDAPLTATFTLTRSNAPVITSANNATFSTTGSNTFTITAAGTPAPTFSATGLPSGVNLASVTGLLTGTPPVGGPYVIAITAQNGVNPNGTQTFTLTASGLAGQAINFTNPGTQLFGTNLIALSATGGGSGNPVTFSSITLSVCTVSGSNVTMIGLGTCTIAANQAGNGTYSAAPLVLQNFGIVGSVPGAPTVGIATVGNGQASVAFAAPASSGGSVITSYTVSCSGISATGNSSPIIVPMLTNGVLYSCTVTATNALGTGPASASVAVTPAAVALSLVNVVSRKVHGTAGTFALPLVTGVPIAGAITVESRLIGTGHTIAFQFSETIASAGTVTAVDGASAAIANSVSFAGNEVIVVLTGVADRTRATVTLANVNGTGLGVTFPVSIGFLVGDQNGSYQVDGGDISAIRARSGQTASAINFRGDFNASGTIDGGDISTVRARSGNNLP